MKNVPKTTFPMKLATGVLAGGLAVIFFLLLIRFAIPLMLADNYFRTVFSCLKAQGETSIVPILPSGGFTTVCRKKFADAGKTCTKGSDCLGEICLTGIEEKPSSSGLYKGKCPAFQSFKNGKWAMPAVYCGTASVENGIIVDDLRKCIF